MWHQQIMVRDAHHRQVELVRFINFYNAVKPYKGLNNATPYEILMTYFNQILFKHQSENNATTSYIYIRITLL